MPRTLSEQEFSALEDALIRQAPSGLDEATFERWIGPRLDGAVAEAEHSNAPVSGSAMRRFIANAATQLNPVTAAQGMYQAVRHPIDTASAAVGQMGDQWNKAGDAMRAGNYSEMVGHGLAGTIPLIGPAAASAGEQIASGDVAGGFGSGAGLLAPTVAPSVMRGVAKVIPNRAATALEAGAAERVADVMSPKVGQNKVRLGGDAERVAPQIAKDLATDGAPFTREGLHADVSVKLKQAEKGLDAAADARDPLATYDTAPILRALKAKRQELVAELDNGMRRAPSGRPQGSPVPTAGESVTPAPNRARAAVLDQAIREVEQLGPTARYESLRRIRQAYDGPAKTVYSPAVTADYLAAQGGKMGAADVTGTLREHLAGFDPQTAAANADYHLYRTADDVLEATREVERTRPRVGRVIAARIFGTVFGGQTAGPLGAAAGYAAAPLLDAAASSGFTTKLQTARLMQNLATAIRGGQAQQVNGVLTQLAKLKRLAPQGGRLVADSVAAAPMGAESQPATPDTTAQR